MTSEQSRAKCHEVLLKKKTTYSIPFAVAFHFFVPLVVRIILFTLSTVGPVNGRWIGANLLEVDYHSTLHFLNQTVDTLHQHAMWSDTVRAPWKCTSCRSLKREIISSIYINVCLKLFSYVGGRWGSLFINIIDKGPESLPTYTINIYIYIKKYLTWTRNYLQETMIRVEVYITLVFVYNNHLTENSSVNQLLLTFMFTKTWVLYTTSALAFFP